MRANLWTILNLDEDHGLLWEDREVLGEDHDQEGSQTEYVARDDPKIRPLPPNGQKRFMAKHTMNMKGPRVTDIDPNTLDSKLFNASNISRAVPGWKGDPHGHTPTGEDDAVYESTEFHESTTPATYRTISGAGRYADELRAVYPDVVKDAQVVRDGFHYGVMVTTHDDAQARAAERPRGFGSHVDSVMSRMGIGEPE